MPRKKRGTIQRLPPVDLHLNNPQQQAVWEHYQLLAVEGEASDWIRDALIAALPARPAVRTPVSVRRGDVPSHMLKVQQYEEVEDTP